jgi:transcriptional regulator with XRE-family HTH domain
MAKNTTSNAVEILRNRYVKDDPERKASIEAERVNAEIARLIYSMRTEAELTQGQLAELVGTTQSVISRLEDCDYDGHSLSMLNRIAEALQKKLTVVMTAKDPEVGVLRYAFHLCMQMLRRKQKMTIDDLAAKTTLDRNELIAMERNPGYHPSPLTLHKLSRFYGIPEKRMLVLAGAVKNVPHDVSQHASRFAAQSESFANLTAEEKRALDDFVKALRNDD